MNTRGHAKMSNDRTTPLLFDFAESDSADKTTNYLKLTPGDFLKNAGNVGFLRLWEFICRDRGEEFEIVDEIPIEKLPDEKKLAQYIMDLYVSEYGGDSKVQKAFDKLDELVERIESGQFSIRFENREEESKFKDELKLINDALTAASIKSGVEGVKENVDSLNLYSDFLKHKLSLPKPKDDQQTALNELKVQIKNLRTFCNQPLIRQTFLFKSVAYNVINRFWTDKCFLLRANAKKNMATLVEEDFTKPFIKSIKNNLTTNNGVKTAKSAIGCISCTRAISKMSEAVPLSFMIDVIDDLARKTSSFWNHNPDAYLCPVCALIYSLAPLGFRRVDSGDFVFINSNESLKTLWLNNAKKIDDSEGLKEQVGVGEDVGDLDGGADTVLRRVDAALLNLLDDKSKILSNVQTIVRTKQENGDGFTYQFNVFDRDLLYLIHKEMFPNLKAPFPTIRQNLAKLAIRKPFMTSNGSYFNVYRHCLDNVLTYQNQYNLLYMLVLESLKDKASWLNVFLAPVFHIQCLQTYHALKRKEKESMENISGLQSHAAKAGALMRTKLLANAVGSENVAKLTSERQEDIVRGVVYRLANALKTCNFEQFIDILIRLYASSKESIPTVFMTALRNETAFPLIGYAYILGLKGALYQPKKSDEPDSVA